MSGAVAIATAWQRPAARRKHLEDDLQRAVMQFLDLALPPDGVAFAVPNGGKRHAREAARMRGMGVKAGIPDIAICLRGRALFIELKAKRGIQSVAQREMQQKLEYCGAVVCLARSVEEVEAALRRWAVPLRARAA